MHAFNLALLVMPLGPDLAISFSTWDHLIHCQHYQSYFDCSGEIDISHTFLINAVKAQGHLLPLQGGFQA